MTSAHGLLIAAEDSAALSPEAPEQGESITVETRLGPVVTHRCAVIEMSQGPLGFAGHTRFALADLPNPTLSRFKLLQSLSDSQVTFVVAPVDPDSGPIQRADLDDACMNAGLAPGNLLVLLIVTVRTLAEGVSLTANLRAPVIIDVARRAGRQVVLGNPEYSVRHPL